jgi:hypothetical protein
VVEGGDGGRGGVVGVVWCATGLSTGSGPNILQMSFDKAVCADP